ncbi:MAG: hypothetical protein ERJ69_03525 [Aphanocapsa feldmannii 288cV]|nr:MAG: hypothetical protein ERJ69_03525 [Aphanocapsa feldmannii 288cV]
MVRLTRLLASPCCMLLGLAGALQAGQVRASEAACQRQPFLDDQTIEVCRQGPHQTITVTRDADNTLVWRRECWSFDGQEDSASPPDCWESGGDGQRIRQSS